MLGRNRRSIASLSALLVSLAAAAPAPAGSTSARAPVAPAALQEVFEQRRALESADLPALEAHLREVAAYVVPAVVGVQAGPVGGSGVIVSEDGLVLTAGHVVRGVDQEVVLLLSDGTRLRGRTLGANRTVDTGMLRITDAGPHPWVDLGAPGATAVGQWCLAAGQPLGFDPRRTPPVRLGRVLASAPHVLQTDCTIVSGDSGGPLFDMNGRVIGIHSRIGASLTENIHAPIEDYRADWDHLVKGEIWGALGRLPGDPDAPYLGARAGRGGGAVLGEVTPNGPADRAALRPGDRVISFGAVPVESFSDLVTQLARRGPGERVPIEVRREGVPMVVELVIGRRGEREVPELNIRAPRSQMRAPELLSVFADAAQVATASVAQVARPGFAEPFARATVLTRDGLLATKASEIDGLHDDIECRFGAGRTLKAAVVLVREAHDLAILRVAAADLQPIEWHDTEPPIASLAIAPGFADELPLVGIVGVGARHYGRSRAFLGVTLASRDDGVRISSVEAGGAAAKAGIASDDLLIRFDERPIRSHEQLLDCLGVRAPGDAVELVVRRGAAEIALSVVLGERPDEPIGRQERALMGDISGRRSDFPEVIQHDLVLTPAQCGGPLVGLDGRAYGINIARSGRVESYALPARVVRAVVARWREQQRAEQLRQIHDERTRLAAELTLLHRQIADAAVLTSLLGELERALEARDTQRIEVLEALVAQKRLECSAAAQQESR